MEEPVPAVVCGDRDKALVVVPCGLGRPGADLVRDDGGGPDARIGTPGGGVAVEDVDVQVRAVPGQPPGAGVLVDDRPGKRAGGLPVAVLNGGRLVLGDPEAAVQLLLQAAEAEGVDGSEAGIDQRVNAGLGDDPIAEVARPGVALGDGGGA